MIVDVVPVGYDGVQPVVAAVELDDDEHVVVREPGYRWNDTLLCGERHPAEPGCAEKGRDAGRARA